MLSIRLLLKPSLALCLLAAPGFCTECDEIPIGVPGTLADWIEVHNENGLQITVSRGAYETVYYLVPANGRPGQYIALSSNGSPISGNPTTIANFEAGLGCGGNASTAHAAGPSPFLGRPRSAQSVKSMATQTASPPIAGQAAQGIVLGLFNSDGFPDSAEVTPQAGITVTLFNADGTVLSTKTYPLPQAEPGIVAADFNGDGNIDLAVLQDSNGSGPGSVAILLGHGDGTFGTATNFPAGPEPLSIAMADFNGDGKIDLAVGNSGGSIDILLGKGDGTFAAPATYAVAQNPVSMVATDINGDGKIDLVMVNGECSESVDQLQVFLGNGDGTFQPLVVMSIATSCGDVAYTDLNHDGKIDLLVVDPGSNAIDALFGNGDGTFDSPQS